jgi:hypothetical protein
VTLLYPELRARGASSRQIIAGSVYERIATFLMEQVITAKRKFYADEAVWAQIMYSD